MADAFDIPHDDPEHKRLDEDRADRRWRRWGPWLSDRQWGTVREDYSADGNAWKYLPHDMARSRAYRWGEDGLAGLCDDRQRLCLGIALDYCELRRQVGRQREHKKDRRCCQQHQTIGGQNPSERKTPRQTNGLAAEKFQAS